MMKYQKADLRDGTAMRLSTQLESAKHFLVACEEQLAKGMDVAQTAEALSTATDRILASAHALRALDSLDD